MELARKWIETNGSFAEGVKILGLLGGNVKPFSQLAQQRFITQESKNQLRAAIQALIPQETATKPGTPSPYQEPEIVTQYRSKGRKLLKVQADLHTRMKLAPDDTTRYEIAETLMEEVIPEIDRIYDALRAYEDDGAIPASLETDAVRMAAQKLNRRKVLYDRIVRVQRWIAAGKRDKGIPLSPEDVEAYEKEILEKSAELEALCIELGMKNNLEDGATD
jgi:hypothetical protein